MAPPRRANFEQVFALPPRLEDWLPADHPARFIRDFVAMLDLPALGFIDKEVIGPEAPYAMDLMLRVWLYGLFERFRTTRRLEWACYNVIALRWLTGNQPPDHVTLWRFFGDHKPALKALFRQSVRVAAQMGLVGMVLHAIDGTKIQAACSTDTADHRAALLNALSRLERAVERAFDRMQDDPAPTDSGLRLPATMADAQARLDAVRASLAQLDAAQTDHLHPGEPEARMMQGAGKGHAMGYNAQAAVDADHYVVVSADVSAEANDTQQLVPMVEQIHQVLGENADQTVVDSGYSTAAQIDAVREQGQARIVVAGLEPSAKADAFDKSRFRYDPDRDEYVCPRGKSLPLVKVMEKDPGQAYAVYHCDETRCPERHACTRSPQGRAIARRTFEDAVDAQRAEQQTPDAQAALRWRKQLIELVFARAKWIEGLVRFTARGLIHAQTQWAMLCTTLNLRAMFRAWKSGYPLPAICPR